MMGEEGFTHASVVVVMFAIIPSVKPSISSGLTFLATLANDFEIMFKPFLHWYQHHFINLLPQPNDEGDILDSLVRHVREDDLTS